MCKAPGKPQQRESQSCWRSCLEEIPKASNGGRCCSVDASLAKGPPGNSGRESEVKETVLSIKEGRGPFIGKTLGRHPMVFRGRGSKVPGQVALSSHRAVD